MTGRAAVDEITRMEFYSSTSQRVIGSIRGIFRHLDSPQEKRSERDLVIERASRCDECTIFVHRKGLGDAEVGHGGIRGAQL